MKLSNTVRLAESDLAELNLLELIRDMGGTVSISKLVVEMYRKQNVIADRTKLNQRLYRMAQKGWLHSAERGRYSIYRPKSTPEAAQP
jgi:DNA-binding transcriptional regulator PaaX